ncbi:CBS domain-containing protein CBSX1, chloroplastic-like [Salvia hispanica]|uniref:CBS domain-containing protein CBSX1, chloroplastic-like n=1 Tax=Salvia hispanica TaxID=49212 RepID=UPI002008F1BB|nr:CBS domain-containing protein CBSX1, chloroplastic-like [Salvia hispanica]
MDSIIFAQFPSVFSLSGADPLVHGCSLPCVLTCYTRSPLPNPSVTISTTKRRRPESRRPLLATAGATNSAPERERTYNVGEFMTRKEQLHVVRPTTTVDEALDTLVEKRVTGFPVVDDDWKLVGVVSDYDLLALDSISGGGEQDSTNLFPVVGSTWKTFNEVQKLLSKTNGKVVGDVMTPSPLVVRENTNLEDAARLLLKTKYRRLPVVDIEGKLIGIITRGDVVRAALQIKQAAEEI